MGKKTILWLFLNLSVCHAGVQETYPDGAPIPQQVSQFVYVLENGMIPSLSENDRKNIEKLPGYIASDSFYTHVLCGQITLEQLFQRKEDETLELKIAPQFKSEFKKLSPDERKDIVSIHLIYQNIFRFKHLYETLKTEYKKKSEDVFHPISSNQERQLNSLRNDLNACFRSQKILMNCEGIKYFLQHTFLSLPAFKDPVGLNDCIIKAGFYSDPPYLPALHLYREKYPDDIYSAAIGNILNLENVHPALDANFLMTRATTFQNLNLGDLSGEFGVDAKNFMWSLTPYLTQLWDKAYRDHDQEAWTFFRSMIQEPSTNRLSVEHPNNYSWMKWSSIAALGAFGLSVSGIILPQLYFWYATGNLHALENIAHTQGYFRDYFYYVDPVEHYAYLNDNSFLLDHMMLNQLLGLAVMMDVLVFSPFIFLPVCTLTIISHFLFWRHVCSKTSIEERFNNILLTIPNEEDRLHLQEAWEDPTALLPRPCFSGMLASGLIPSLQMSHAQNDDQYPGFFEWMRWHNFSYGALTPQSVLKQRQFVRSMNRIAYDKSNSISKLLWRKACRKHRALMQRLNGDENTSENVILLV